MRLLNDSLGKLQSLLKEIAVLKRASFPYPDAKDAIDAIEQHFDSHKHILTASQNLQIIQSASIQLMTDIINYQPMLGFVMRSLDVRNSFEIYKPLSRICQKLLGAHTKVILSSEWEFSPHTIIKIPALKDYVLLGSPVFECRNPLLIPVAGHEIGHSVWDHYNIIDKVNTSLLSNIFLAIKNKAVAYTAAGLEGVPTDGNQDMYVIGTAYSIYKDAARQIEEIFCDMFAITMFAESYLHAFRYLLSPGQIECRTAEYPSDRERIKYMKNFAVSLGIRTNMIDEMDFADPGFDSQKSKFLGSIADEVAAKEIAILSSEAQLISKQLTSTTAEDVNKCIVDFRKMIPSKNGGCIGSILRAGWECFEDAQLWSHRSDASGMKKEILSDLILKSIEVLEYNFLVQGTDYA